MSFENTHFTAKWKIYIVVFVIFKGNIIEETLKIKRLLSTNNIKHFILFHKWEGLS